VLIAGGTAIAVEGDDLLPTQRQSALILAEAAASALGAGFVAIEIAVIEGELVVWDVLPVPEYRGMRPLAAGSVEDALRAFVLRERADGAARGGLHVTALIGREALDGVVLSA